MKIMKFIKAVVTKEAVIKAAPAIAAGLTVLLAPFGVGGKLICGVASYAIVRLVKANVTGEDLTTDDVVTEVANGAMLLVVGGLIMSPTIICPVVSVAAKFYLFALARKFIHDICVSERNVVPFERHSFEVTLSNKGRVINFTI